MEDWGTDVGSNVDDALVSVLRGKETPEEREEALISFIRDYDKSAKEYEADLMTKATIKNYTIVIVAIIAMILGGVITGVIMSS